MQYKQEKIPIFLTLSIILNLFHAMHVLAVEVQEKEDVAVISSVNSIEVLEEDGRYEQQSREEININKETRGIVQLELEIDQEVVLVLESEPKIQPEFSEEDIMNLTCLVFAESGNQKVEGQISVAAVTINRKRDIIQFAEEMTISEVIFAKSAFANIQNIDFSEAKEVGCYEAVIEAINENDPTEQLLWDEAKRLGLDPKVYAEGGALYFYNPDYCSEEELQKRANIKCKVQIGDHIFYKVWDQ